MDEQEPTTSPRESLRERLMRKDPPDAPPPGPTKDLSASASTPSPKKSSPPKAKTQTSPGSAPADTAEQIGLGLSLETGEPAQVYLDKPDNPANKQSGEKTCAGPGRNPDLRVDIDLGATIPVGQFGNVRPVLAIRGLDPYGDVEAQIEAALAAGVVAFARIDDTVRVLVDSKLVSENETGSSLSERVGALEAFDKKVVTNINTLAAMVKKATTPETPEA